MKILYFDYWSHGAKHNILPLDSLLKERGIERVLGHVGSWRDRNTPAEAIVDGLICRDIRFYGDSLRGMLQQEQPDLVYVLNFGGVVDRLVNRTCRDLGIKTVFLMHGILPLGKDIEIEKKYVNKSFTLKRRLQKVPKYFKIYCKYFREIFDSQPHELLFPQTYAHLVQMALSPGSMYTSPWKNKDLYPDRVLLFADAYRDLFQHKLGCDPEMIRIVGYPQLDPVLQKVHSDSFRRDLLKFLEQSGVDVFQPWVVFIVDGLYDHDKHNVDVWLSELHDVSAVTKSLGLTLILKLHPSNDRTLVERKFQGSPWVKVFQNEVDLSIVDGAIAALGHFSSALLVPVALNIPLFIPKWTDMYRDYDYYISNGAGIPVASLSDLETFLCAAREGTLKPNGIRDKFVDRYIGKIDGYSWCRVARELTDFLEES